MNMKIAFFSNFLNHHQLPFCQELFETPDVDFVFVATEQIPEYRIQMGYRDMNIEYPFVLREYENEENRKQAKQIALTYDGVIFGSAPMHYLDARMGKNLLTFRFCERSLKKGTWRRFIPRTRKRIYREYTQYKNNNLYILGASAYTASDLALCGFPKEKCFQWGYFPEIKQYDSIEDVIAGKKPNSILWVARFIKLKHPEVPLYVAKRLQKEGYDFQMNLIGSGELEGKIRKFVQNNNLSDRVHLLGVMSPEDVRKNMEQSEIFLFTSDRHEGWGAVMNESMNSACAVVASRSIGSVPVLIQHGKNGFIYQNGKKREVFQYVKNLLDHPSMRREIGKAAFLTLSNVWNAHYATEQFLKLIKRIKENGPAVCEGPCADCNV